MSFRLGFPVRIKKAHVCWCPCRCLPDYPSCGFLFWRGESHLKITSSNNVLLLKWLLAVGGRLGETSTKVDTEFAKWQWGTTSKVLGGHESPSKLGVHQSFRAGPIKVHTRKYATTTKSPANFIRVCCLFCWLFRLLTSTVGQVKVGESKHANPFQSTLQQGSRFYRKLELLNGLAPGN